MEIGLDSGMPTYAGELGVLAFVIHGCFIHAGRPEFTLSVSLGLLALILMVSLLQGFYALKELCVAGTL